MGVMESSQIVGMKFLVLLTVCLSPACCEAEANPQVPLPPVAPHHHHLLLQQQQQYLANLATAGRFAYTVNTVLGSGNTQDGDEEDAATLPPQLPFPFFPPYQGLAAYQPWGYGGQPWAYGGYGGYGGYPGHGYNNGFYPGYGFNPYYPRLPAHQAGPQENV